MTASFGRVAIVAMSSLCWSCGGPSVVKAYPGLARPELQLATLAVGPDTGVTVRGSEEFQCRPKPTLEDQCQFQLLPGPHRLLVWYEAKGARANDARSIDLEVEVGRTYSVSAAPVFTLDDWAITVFDETDGNHKQVFSDLDQHCKRCLHSR